MAVKRIDPNTLSAAEKAIYEAALADAAGKSGGADVAGLQKELNEMKATLSEWGKFGTWYRQTVEPHWKPFVEYVSKGGKQEPAAPAANKGGDDPLTDEEIRTRFATLKTENEALMKDKETQFLGLFGLYDKINSLKGKKEGFDSQKVLNYMREHRIQDPEQAYQLVYGEQERESYASKKIEEAKKEWDIEAQKKATTSLPPSGPVPRKIAPPDTAKTARQATQSAREAVAVKYGANVLLPNGLPK